MYSNEEYFVWDMQALKEVLANVTPRNLLDASAILRRLLIDGSNSVLHKVAKSRDFKPLFKISDNDEFWAATQPESGKKPISLFRYHSLVPYLMPSDRTKLVGLDDFLATKCYGTEDADFTVKDMIRYTANVGGGVHHGMPRNKDNAQEIHAVADQVQIMGQPFPLDGMRAITFIVVKALAPLYELVRHNIGGRNP